MLFIGTCSKYYTILFELLFVVGFGMDNLSDNSSVSLYDYPLLENPTQRNQNLKDTQYNHSAMVSAPAN